MSGIHGTSTYIKTDGSGGESAEFYDFAPCPCVCLGCCAPHYQKTRTFFNVYDNRLEGNYPIAPFGICTLYDVCVMDSMFVQYYDRPPTRIGTICCCVPCTCCGPPVLFVEKPMFLGCCFDTSDWYGQKIKAAPCTCCGLRSWLCCGSPCYKYYSYDLATGIKNGDDFLAKWDAKLSKYWSNKNLDFKERATFASLRDSAFDHTREQQISARE